MKKCTCTLAYQLFTYPPKKVVHPTMMVEPFAYALCDFESSISLLGFLPVGLRPRILSVFLLSGKLSAAERRFAKALCRRNPTERLSANAAYEDPFLKNIVSSACNQGGRSNNPIAGARVDTD